MHQNHHSKRILKGFKFGIFVISTVLFWSGCTVESAKRSYILAEKLWADGKYGASVKEFEKVMAIDPKGKLGLQARFRAAMTQTLYLENHGEAIRNFRVYIKAGGIASFATWEARKQIGDIYFERMQKYGEAISHYSELLKEDKHPEDRPQFLYRIGRSHFFRQEFKDALKNYRRVVKKYPKSPWREKAAFEIGMTLYTQGKDYQAAMDSFRWYLRRFPQSKRLSEAKFGIAAALEELDQFESAISQYEAILDSYPAPNVIRIKIARIRERQRRKGQ